MSARGGSASASGGGLTYERTCRVGTKTSTSEPKSLDEYLQQGERSGLRGFPFESGVSVATHEKSVYLTRSGFIQGKAWKVAGACRRGDEREPHLLLVKAKSDSQLALIRHRDLKLLGYDLLVSARAGEDALTPAAGEQDQEQGGAHACHDADCRRVVLWTRESIQAYREGALGKNGCRKYALGARMTFRDEEVLACKFSAKAGGPLVAFLSSPQDGTFRFKLFYTSDLSSKEVGPAHRLGFKPAQAGQVALSCEDEANLQALVSSREGKLVILDARLGAVASSNGLSSGSPAKSVAWHRKKGLALCLSNTHIFALDQALQPLQWHGHGEDLREEPREALKVADLMPRGGDGPSVLSWDQDTPNAATLSSENETVQLSLGSASGGDASSFGSSDTILRSYLGSRQWDRMRTLLECSYLTTSDLQSLMVLVEDMAEASAVDRVSAWKMFSFLLKHVSARISGETEAGNTRKFRRQRRSMSRVALDYLSKGNYEAAVMIASTLDSPTLCEFLYKFLMQHGEARLANICWHSLGRSGSGAPRERVSALDKPKTLGVLFAPATLKALQHMSKAA